MRKETHWLIDEISLIFNIQIQKYVIEALEAAPESFFYLAASSSGKYHPEISLGEHGLIRHTKATIRIAKDLFIMYGDDPIFSQHKKDLILAALILHDTCKYGLDGAEHTVKDHSVLAVQHLSWCMQNQKFITKKDEQIILNAIASHMGRWVKTSPDGDDLPEPETVIELFVHQCDYLASRKYINELILE